jgi:hypothetical protein
MSFDDDWRDLDIEDHDIRVTVALHTLEEQRDLIALLINAGFLHFTVRET